MGAILFSAEFLPEFQPIRADLSFFHSFFGPGPISKACFWWEQPSWMLIFITLFLGFVGSKNDKVMLPSPVLWYDIDPSVYLCSNVAVGGATISKGRVDLCFLTL